jgi:hypothetical protein
MEAEKAIKLSNKLWKNNEGMAISSRGSFGGLYMVWNNLLFHLDFNYHTQHWLLTQFLHQQIDENINIINIYIPSNYNEKLECLDSFLVLQNLEYWKCNIVANKFNTTLNQKEKQGESTVQDLFWERMEEFISLCILWM